MVAQRDSVHCLPTRAWGSIGGEVHALEALVRMKLTSFRRKDQVRLLDMLDVGLIDQTWRRRLPDELASRLGDLIEHADD